MLQLRAIGKAQTRLWFPVGRLDVYDEGPSYCFRYTGGAKRAKREAGFPPLLEFPRLDETYWSPELSPVFQNRVMNRARSDFGDYLRYLDLHKEADPIEILRVNGGSRVTDTYEVFPKLVKHNTSDSFDVKVAARNLQFYSCVPQRNREKEGLRATASECTCDLAPHQETATKIHRPSAGADAEATRPCHVS